MVVGFLKTKAYISQIHVLVVCMLFTFYRLLVLLGWEVPHWYALPGDDGSYKPSFRRTNWFEPVGRECEMVMNRAGLIDLTPFGKIEVKGPDASKFIDYMCANTVPKVSHKAEYALSYTLFKK